MERNEVNPAAPSSRVIAALLINKPRLAMAEWRPIEEAFKDARVTGEQRTIFVMRFGKEAYPSFNTVYYDPLSQAGFAYPWVHAEGGSSYHRDWPTHWMFAADAAAMPNGALAEEPEERQK